MQHPEVVWGSAIGGMVAVDYWVSKRYDNATLSWATRRTFKVHTKTGRLLFIGGWVVLSAWFLPHIIQPTIEQIADDWTER